MIRLVRKLDVKTPGETFTTLTLAFDQRNKSRQRVILDNGEAAALLLPRGSILRAEDRIAADDGEHQVRVRAADETLSVVFCGDRLLLNRVCYHLGNRHVPLQVMVDRVCYRHDHVLDAMVSGLGIIPTTQNAPFEPEPGAYGHGHGDTRSHG